LESAKNPAGVRGGLERVFFHEPERREIWFFWFPQALFVGWRFARRHLHLPPDLAGVLPFIISDRPPSFLAFPSKSKRFGGELLALTLANSVDFIFSKKTPYLEEKKQI
jgi:hypothetical protein